MPHRGEIIVVASGKCGVGKTNLALNLGIQFARRGARAILADADFGLANADILLNLPSHANISSLLDESRSPEDLLVEGPGGLRVLCGISGFAQEGELCELRPAQCTRAIERLDVLCDALLIDCGSGVSDSLAAFALSCDRLVLVTTPEPTSLADAYALLKILYSRGFRRPVGVVVNMSRSHEDGRAAAARLRRVTREFLGLELDELGAIPHDRHVASAVRERSPVVVRYPRCPASQSIDAISCRLAPQTEDVSASGVWTRMANLFF